MWTANKRLFSTLKINPGPGGSWGGLARIVIISLSGYLGYAAYDNYGKKNLFEELEEKLRTEREYIKNTELNNNNKLRVNNPDNISIQIEKKPEISESKSDSFEQTQIEEVKSPEINEKTVTESIRLEIQSGLDSSVEKTVEINPSPPDLTAETIKDPEVSSKLTTVNVEELKSSISEPETPSPDVNAPVSPSTPDPNDSSSEGTPTSSASSKSDPQPDYSALDISQLKLEIQEEYKKRENELFEKLESSFALFLHEYSPRLAQSSSPGKVLSEQLDFSKYSIEDLQKKYENIITAYEERLENLGVKNYDAFIERLRDQKRKWKLRLEQAQADYQAELQQKIKDRDEQWAKFLENEQNDAELHYEQQSKLDEEYVKQKTVLQMTKEFEQELKSITLSLEQATESRLKQLEDIILKIKEMETIQSDHFNIITKLKSIHNVHVSIENLQRTLNYDTGNLTRDLNVVIEEAKNDEVIQNALGKIEYLYNDMVEKGIPKLKQIQKHFEIASNRARRAALIKEKTLGNVLASMIAIKFIPKNIKTVDDADTFSILRSAEIALEKGNLRQALQEITQLKGYPSEEMTEVVKDISIRLAMTDLLEILSGYTVSVVQNLLTNRVIN
jgi:Mitochondrial inner membrane protein